MIEGYEKEFVNTFDSSPNYNIDEHMPALTQTPDLQPADAPEFMLCHLASTT